MKAAIPRPSIVSARSQAVAAQNAAKTMNIKRTTRIAHVGGGEYLGLPGLARSLESRLRRCWAVSNCIGRAFCGNRLDSAPSRRHFAQHTESIISTNWVRLTAPLLLGVLTACASHRPREKVDGEFLPPDYFASQSQCIGAWAGVIEEWLNSGGKFHASLLDVREAIADDRKTRLAAMVRAAWHKQAEPIPPMKFGTWPVDDDVGLAVAVSFEARRLRGVEPYCRSVVWFGGMLGDEASRDGGMARFREVPDDMAWDSPSDKQWLTFWLLARIE